MKMGIRICKTLNVVFKSLPMNLLFKCPALGTRKNPETYAEWEFKNAVVTLSHFRPYDNITGKTILDIGCGLGGKSTYYALNGAKYVTAIDIDTKRIEEARELAARKKVGNICFEIQDATSFPYELEKFDLIIFNDSFEHIEKPEVVLKGCYKALRKGGTVNIVFPPYSSPWGAHLFAHIQIPWAQFLFSEKTLVNLWKEKEKSIWGVNTAFYSSHRICAIEKATRISALTHLNKMTIKKLDDMLNETPFKCRLFRLCTPGDLFSFLTSFTSIREYIVTRAVVVLEK